MCLAKFRLPVIRFLKHPSSPLLPPGSGITCKRILKHFILVSPNHSFLTYDYCSRFWLSRDKSRQETLNRWVQPVAVGEDLRTVQNCDVVVIIIAWSMLAAWQCLSRYCQYQDTNNAARLTTILLLCCPGYKKDIQHMNLFGLVKRKLSTPQNILPVDSHTGLSSLTLSGCFCIQLWYFIRSFWASHLSWLCQ